MDNQPTLTTPTQETSATTDAPTKKTGKKKMLMGFGSILSVLIIAGATYGILDMTTGQKASQVKQVTTVEKVDTPETIDSQIQAYMNSEQKLEEELSDSESQVITDDVNATQGLEESYADL